MALTHQLLTEIQAVAKQYRIPANYFLGLIRQESGFSMGSTSPVGAIGYTQLMPGTARGLGVNPHDPHQNLVGGAKYLRQQLDRYGDITKALAAYNAGPGAVAKYNGVPPYAETQNYVKQVARYAKMYAGLGGSVTGASNPIGRTDSIPPQVSITSPELATAPTLPALPRTPTFGVMGTSVRSPTLKIAPLSLPRPTLSGGTDTSGLFSGAGSSGGGGSPAGVGYPLGIKGNVIGTPHSGTHTLGNWQSDNAVDLSAKIGTPIYAVASGTIGSRIGSLGKGGRFAGLRLTLQTNGNAFYYAHLSKLSVRAGQRVKAGQLLGYSGEANGVGHLHIGAEFGDIRKLLGL